MKRMFFSVLLIIAITGSGFAREFVASGKSYTALGDYKIEISDKPITMDGKEYKTYIISYQNSPMEVTVVIRNGNNCLNYIVLSDKLSVQYVCNESYFGVERLGIEASKEGFVTSDVALNKNQFFHQKAIGAGKNSEITNTQLIASYFPVLIKGIGEPVAFM